MLLEEWNMEDAKKVWREEAREEGREEGMAIGIEKGRDEGRLKERQRFFELLDRGLSAEEIKRQLSLENYDN